MNNEQKNAKRLVDIATSVGERLGETINPIVSMRSIIWDEAPAKKDLMRVPGSMYGYPTQFYRLMISDPLMETLDTSPVIRTIYCWNKLLSRSGLSLWGIGSITGIRDSAKILNELSTHKNCYLEYCSTTELPVWCSLIDSRVHQDSKLIGTRQINIGTITHAAYMGHASPSWRGAALQEELLEQFPLENMTLEGLKMFDPHCKGCPIDGRTYTIMRAVVFHRDWRVK